MAKSVKVTYKGDTYVLCYDREIVGQMTDAGFSPDQLCVNPAKQIPLLVKGAFCKNHPDVSAETIDALYDSLKDKTGFVSKLSEVVAETYISLFADPDEKEGNAEWEATF